MDAILHFFTAQELWIYLLLGLVGLVYLRKLVLAIQEWQGAMFGMERHNAQGRLNEAIGLLVLLSMLGIGEFFLVTFVSPNLPASPFLPTPTMDALATQPIAQVQVTPLAPGTPQAAPAVRSSGCIAGQLEFTEPVAGSTVSGKVTLKGNVRLPDFGFYKYEFAPAGNQTWTTIQAGDAVRCADAACINPQATDVPPDVLGDWDTSLLVPGDYILRLVVTDNQGRALPACELPIRIIAPPTE